MNLNKVDRAAASIASRCIAYNFLTLLLAVSGLIGFIGNGNSQVNVAFNMISYWLPVIVFIPVFALPLLNIYTSHLLSSVLRKRWAENIVINQHAHGMCILCIVIHSVLFVILLLLYAYSQLWRCACKRGPLGWLDLR